jgi:hypothetical protein
LKILDYFNYPSTLDLSPFLSSTSTKSASETLYDLYAYHISLISSSEILTLTFSFKMFVFESVNVHQGDSSGETGHFYTFLNCPNINLLDHDTKHKNETSSCVWYLFNDEIVRRATIQEVFDNNFGGPSSLQHACILVNNVIL